MAVLGRLSEAGRVMLIDHHCHGVVGQVAGQAAFELLATEGFDPPPPGTSHLDSPLGLAIRRWCAPILDLQPLVSGEEYLARRLSLGADEVNRRLLRASGVEALLVDTGYRTDELLNLEEMADASGAEVHEVVRLETVAEEVARLGGAADGFPKAFRERLWSRLALAAGLKTIAAYRCGLDLDPEPPSNREVVGAVGSYLRALSERADLSLRSPILIRFGLWEGIRLAAERGIPIQVHAGFGDPDLTLHLADPSRFTPFVKAIRPYDVAVVFLHCYPYHRQAAYLATVFPNVYFDLGGSLNHLGPSAPAVLSEALEIAPFTKQLYSSDAFGLAEFYAVGSAVFRTSLETALGQWRAEGGLSSEDAQRIAAQIGRENARRIYPALAASGR
jgi:predicted TIM-barrel fold metal-dependent hydrolase